MYIMVNAKMNALKDALLGANVLYITLVQSLDGMAPVLSAIKNVVLMTIPILIPTD